MEKKTLKQKELTDCVYNFKGWFLHKSLFFSMCSQHFCQRDILISTITECLCPAVRRRRRWSGTKQYCPPKRHRGTTSDTGGAVTYCICIYICTQAYTGEMTCTSSPLRWLKRMIKKNKRQNEKKSTGLAVTNATETDTHTRTITWMFDGMQQCFFAIMTSKGFVQPGDSFLRMECARVGGTAPWSAQVGDGGTEGGWCKFGFSHHTCITPHGAFGYPTWVWPQVHLPEAITTKSDFLLCEYLFIMKMLLGWGGVRRWDDWRWMEWETDGQTEPIIHLIIYHTHNPLYHHYSVHLHGKSGWLSRSCFNPIVPTQSPLHQGSRARIALQRPHLPHLPPLLLHSAL